MLSERILSGLPINGFLSGVLSREPSSFRLAALAVSLVSVARWIGAAGAQGCSLGGADGWQEYGRMV